MSKNEKSTPKAKVLTAVLLIVFLGSCAVLAFAICTDILGIAPKNPNPTEPQVTTAVSVTESATTEATEATEASSSASVTQSSTAVSSQLILGSTYNVDYWAEYKTENGSSGLGVLFGAHTQSAEINFTDDNKFSIVVFANNEPVEVSSGTYSFSSQSEIELRYENSNIETAVISETENGVVTVMDFSMDVDDTTLRISLAD